MNFIKMFEQKSIGELINLVATAFNSLKDILYILQVDQSQYTYLFANQAGLSILTTDETLFGKTMDEYLPKEKAQYLRTFYEKAVISKTVVTFEDETTLLDGQIMINETVLTPIIDGEIVYLVAIVRDVTDKTLRLKELQQYKRAEQARRESEETFRIIAENSVDIIKVLTPEGNITYVSPSIEDILGYPKQKMISKSFLETVHPDDREKMNDVYLNLIETKENVEIEVRRKHQDGHFIWLHSDLIPVLSSEGQLEKIVVISWDITEYKRKVKKLEKLAFYDHLTGLPNRRIFIERLQQSMFTTDRRGKWTALMVLDCDNFKQINDNHGHDIGDEVIKEFSNRIRRVIRDTDTLSRVGGDEFTVVIPEIIDKQQVIDISNRILNVVSQPMEIKEHVLNITTSIGISFYPHHGTDTEELFKKADENLYKSKSLGGNTFSL
ncbi:diguanylate cyclase domain-containing protein [Fredinandcohnia onubensis]|uniref:diguanylate cyclase domain-containing protein n=1 Tax=Fredinandcohnia onubensis TaxID=1571209 RepID=UPI000C0BCC1F|nr:diguanylate cyclase [Fredinandcohnia onubensis]